LNNQITTPTDSFNNERLGAIGIYNVNHICRMKHFIHIRVIWKQLFFFWEPVR